MPRTARRRSRGEPDREPERGEREEREHPRKRLQELERVLCRVELVGAEDHDLAGVGGDLVGDLIADTDAVGGLEDDRRRSSVTSPPSVETRSPPPSSTWTSVVCDSSSATRRDAGRRGCSSARLTIWYEAWRRPAVAAPDRPL